jgi:hypothetical protein
MLDLETLSTRPDATILTFGACKFSPYNQEAIDKIIYFRVNVDEQIALGRHVDNNTLAWWATQDDDIREEAFGEGDRISLEQFTQELNRFIVGCHNIWAQGPVFDIGILENLYRQLGLPCPWQYWQIRDSRTLLSVHGHGDVINKRKAGLHNAIEDAISQAQTVQIVFEQCGITEKH